MGILDIRRLAVGIPVEGSLAVDSPAAVVGTLAVGSLAAGSSGRMPVIECQ